MGQEEQEENTQEEPARVINPAAADPLALLEEIPLRERRSIKLLGKPDRAEKLVSWSRDKAKPGTRHKEEFPNGLTLVFVANESEPKVYLHFNPKKFQDYLANLRSPERLFQVNWGIALEFHPQRLKLRVLTVGRKERIILWDTANSFCKEHASENVSWLCGMIRFRETGPAFLPQPACQAELEEAAALAVIDKTASRPRVAAKLPAATQAASKEELQKFFANPLVVELLSTLKERAR